jgi:GNAT superfamily N-acetyltransferase
MITEIPLTKENRIKLARAFMQVPRVDFSIDCAIEGQMGTAFVDDLEDPKVLKIQVSGFFYLAGDATSPAAQTMLHEIEPYSLFMPSAPGWLEAGKALYGERLIGFDRFSFSSEQLSSDHLNALIQGSKHIDDLQQMDRPFVESLWGRDHFVDLAPFDSCEDFLHRGVGFYVKNYDRIVGAAYSSLVCSRGIEVSLFVIEDYRRQGIGTLLASRLLTWCLENNAVPNWDAANPESCHLAEKLGYLPTGVYQAFYLVPDS